MRRHSRTTRRTASFVDGPLSDRAPSALHPVEGVATFVPGYRRERDGIGKVGDPMTREPDHRWLTGPPSARGARFQAPGLDGEGVAAGDLSDDDLLPELAQLHRTRHDAFLHAPTAALQHHSERTAELELEYLRRRPERDIDETRVHDDRTGHAGPTRQV